MTPEEVATPALNPLRLQGAPSCETVLHAHVGLDSRVRVEFSGEVGRVARHVGDDEASITVFDESNTYLPLSSPPDAYLPTLHAVDHGIDVVVGHMAVVADAGEVLVLTVSKVEIIITQGGAEVRVGVELAIRAYYSNMQRIEVERGGEGKETGQKGCVERRGTRFGPPGEIAHCVGCEALVVEGERVVLEALERIMMEVLERPVLGVETTVMMEA